MTFREPHGPGVKGLPAPWRPARPYRSVDAGTRLAVLSRHDLVRPGKPYHQGDRHEHGEEDLQADVHLVRLPDIPHHGDDERGGGKTTDPQADGLPPGESFPV